jgi:hypothetical protein
MEQLNLNPENLPVVLLGEIEKDDANFKIAYTYIRNLEFLDPNIYNTKSLGNDNAHDHFILKNAL